MSRRALLVLLPLLVILIGGGAYAAECPTLGSLGEITVQTDFSPVRMATSSAGNTYVTDYMNNLVKMFNRAGAQVRSIRVMGPLGVAVGADGRVYIGRATQYRLRYAGEVLVYDETIEHKLGHLGAGAGEFEYPGALRVDGDIIYVADSRRNSVYRYDLGSLAQAGTLSGYGLLRPTDVAVHPATGDVYVTDMKLQTDTQTEPTGSITVDGDPSKGLGAGVHVYGADGVYKWSFPIVWGYQPATAYKVAAPSGVEIDSQGRVYITDAGKGELQVYDSAGVYVCHESVTSYSSDPAGVRISGDGRLLFVVKDAVKEFTTEDYVELAVSPEAVDAYTQDCGAAAAGRTVTVSNLGSGTLEWSASEGSAWMSLSSAGGSISGSGSEGLVVNMDASQAAYGLNVGEVVVSSNAGDETIEVRYTRYAAPVLNVGAGAYEFEVRGDVLPGSVGLNVSLTGDMGGYMKWYAGGDMGWIGVSPTQGPSNTMSLALVGVSDAGLDALGSGTYTGKVTVGAGCAEVAEQEVQVTLRYLKGGTIRVETNTADAIYTISGPEALSGAGEDTTFDVVAAGTYTISFGEVAGHIKPAGYSLEVANGETAVFSGGYRDLRERLGIVATVTEARASVADEIREYDAAGELAGTMVLRAGSASKGSAGQKRVGSTVCSGDVDGDGADEYMVGYPGGVVAGYEADGSRVPGIYFRAYESASDVDVACGDFDGDGRSEIVVSEGTASGNNALVRVFRYAAGGVVDTGVQVLAYVKKHGANVAVGDVDGDGVDEIVTGRGGNGGLADIRIWDVEVNDGVWGVADGGYIRAGVSEASVDVAVGDVNADGVDEIVVIKVADADAASGEIVVYGASGEELGGFAVPVGRGASIAAGDVDYDGSAEIVVGDGASGGGESLVRIYEAGGAEIGSFAAYDSADVYGVRVSLSRMAGQ